MALDDETLSMLESARQALPAEVFQLPVPQLRAMLSGGHPGGAVSSVHARDLEVPGPAGPLVLRVYHPGGSDVLPVLVWFHGGGFVLGGLDHSDRTCEDLAVQAGCVVVAVDFRLAPEHPYPAAPEDCAAATEWVVQNASALGGDPGRVAVGGESSGATLAAVVSQMARDRATAVPALQVLLYPVVQLRASNLEHAGLPMMPIEAAERFWTLYCPGNRRAEPYASPARAVDLAGLPPALVFTAEADLGRDDAEEYGFRLARAGVRTTVRRCVGTVHGFLGMTATLDSSRRAMAELCAALRAELLRAELAPVTPETAGVR